jgi:hypothetical protein
MNVVDTHHACTTLSVIKKYKSNQICPKSNSSFDHRVLKFKIGNAGYRVSVHPNGADGGP